MQLGELRHLALLGRPDVGRHAPHVPRSGPGAQRCRRRRSFHGEESVRHRPRAGHLKGRNTLELLDTHHTLQCQFIGDEVGPAWDGEDTVSRNIAHGRRTAGREVRPVSLPRKVDVGENAAAAQGHAIRATEDGRRPIRVPAYNVRL